MKNSFDLDNPSEAAEWLQAQANVARFLPQEQYDAILAGDTHFAPDGISLGGERILPDDYRRLVAVIGALISRARLTAFLAGFSAQSLEMETFLNRIYLEQIKLLEDHNSGLEERLTPTPLASEEAQ